MTMNDVVSKAMNKQQGSKVVKRHNMDSVVKLLIPYNKNIARALPKHLEVGRIVEMAATLALSNPKLLECIAISPGSFIGAVMQAAILGFKPVAQLGQCYFIPYKNKVTGKKEIQFQIGYKGFIDLARRSGEIKMIYAQEVYANDDFKYTLGLNPVLEHTPYSGSGDPGQLVYAYAVVHYKDGGYNMEVLTRNKIEALRMRHPMQKATPSGVWSTDYAAMAKAKAIKQMSKYMPLSDEMIIATKTDEGIIKLENDNKEPTFGDDGKGVKIEEISYPDTSPITDHEEVGDLVSGDKNVVDTPGEKSVKFVSKDTGKEKPSPEKLKKKETTEKTKESKPDVEVSEKSKENTRNWKNVPDGADVK